MKKNIFKKGQKFEMLTVISDIPEHRKTGKNNITRIYYECQCDCGNIVKIISSRLKFKKTKSCGCLRKSLARAKGKNQRTEESYLKNLLYYGVKGRSNLIKRECNLTFEDFVVIVKQNCFYCNEPPKLREGVSHDSVGIKTPVNGVDRVDSNLGYIKENCVACCPKCNIMKMDLEKQEFLSQIEKIYIYQRNKMFALKNKD